MTVVTAVRRPAPLRAVSSEHTAPAFEIDLRRVRENLSAFRAAFPGAHIHYALKANSHPAVLSDLARLDSGFEAASWGEVRLLLEAGVPARAVIFGTAVKAPADIARAHDHGVRCFAADSAEELEALAVHAPGSAVFVRVKADDPASVFQMGSKFGVEPGSATALVLQARELDLRPAGLSISVGSQAPSASAWGRGVALLAPAVRELLAAGIRLDFINLGGGYPVAYEGVEPVGLSEIAAAVHGALGALPYEPALILEPGRRLVADAVRLFATVIARIERDSGPWLFLDCGVYNALFEALHHQGRTLYPVRRVDRPAEGPATRFVLAGPTGDAPDIIARDVVLPADTQVGDRLLFEKVGAYTMVLASAFNGIAVPEVRVLL